MMMSLFEDLNQIVSEQPNKIALFDGNGRAVTYHQLLNDVESAHGWLNILGLKPGDSLIALLPNAIETLVLFLASMRGGFLYAPLPCTATLPEVNRWKRLTNARFCLIAEPAAHSLQLQIRGLNWQIERIEIGKTMARSGFDIPSIEKNGLLAMASSGSTGEPKAMLLSCDRLWASAKAFMHFHHLENQDLRFWNYLPMSYLGGLFNLALIPLAAQGSVYVDDAFNGKTFLGFWQTIARYQINSLWLVPSILRGLLSLSNRTGQNQFYQNIKHCFLGTAPILLEEKTQFRDVFGIVPIENYGLSETTFITSETTHASNNRSQGSVGRVMPNVEVELRAANNATEEAVTEIWVKTPYALLGYLNENGVMSSPSDERGFIPTGDYGCFVNDELVLTGRQRDIIKKGGILVFLREIEQIVSSYPNVMEAAAVKIEHPFYGESYNLFVQLQRETCDQMLFINKLSAWVHTQIVKEKWPEKIFICADFPKTLSGKIQKHLLIAGGVDYVQ